MTDVERVLAVEEFLKTNPQIETFLIGFFCGGLASLVVYYICYFIGKKGGE